MERSLSETPSPDSFLTRHDPERLYDGGMHRAAEERYPSNGSSPGDPFAYISREENEPTDLRVRDAGPEREAKEVGLPRTRGFCSSV